MGGASGCGGGAKGATWLAETEKKWKRAIFREFVRAARAAAAVNIRESTPRRSDGVNPGIWIINQRRRRAFDTASHSAIMR